VKQKHGLEKPQHRLARRIKELWTLWLRNSEFVSSPDGFEFGAENTVAGLEVSISSTEQQVLKLIRNL